MEHKIGNVYACRKAKASIIITDINQIYPIRARDLDSNGWWNCYNDEDLNNDYIFDEKMTKLYMIKSIIK